MAERPTPVVLLSVHTQADAARTLEALAAGAVDFVDKSSVSRMNVHVLGEELVRKVRLAAQSHPAATTARSTRAGGETGIGRSDVSAVVLGASTGGPAAIQRLIGRLPGDFPLPLLVVQHMPVGFTRAFAERLDASAARSG